MSVSAQSIAKNDVWTLSIVICNLKLVYVVALHSSWAVAKRWLDQFVAMVTADNRLS